MPILNVQVNQPGQAGVIPNIVYIETNDTLAQVTTTGYLNKLVSEGAPFAETTMALVSTKTTPNALSSQVYWLDVSYSGGNWSLSVSVPAGTVTATLPTIANHIATYTNTTANISEDPTTAISAGNIQAGLSGTAGALISFPGTASKGSLHVTGVANTGDTLVTISNAAHGQATVYSIPDVGATTGQFNVVTGALTSGHLMTASGTAGKLADGGFSMKSVAGAAVAGGNAANTIMDAFCTSASNVVGNWNTQSTPASVLTIAPGNGSFVVTSSTDPGASTFNYIITKV